MGQILLLALLALGVGPAGAAEVVVFAAASLTEPLRELAKLHEARSGDRLVFNFAASGTLARQIEAGAPVDVFFSADEATMNRVARRGLIDATTRRSRLSNSLVVVVAADDRSGIRSASDLTNAAIGRIALGDPANVPAGGYARAFLEQARLWDAIRPKVVPVDNVRAALAAVESGNVTAAVVYRTDVAAGRRVRVACAVPESAGLAISYPLALLREAPQPVAARRWLGLLGSGEADRVFLRHGFGVLPLRGTEVPAPPAPSR